MTVFQACNEYVKSHLLHNKADITGMFNLGVHANLQGSLRNVNWGMIETRTGRVQPNPR